MTAPGVTPEALPYLVFPAEWQSSQRIVNLTGPDYRLLFWSDTNIGFEHVCDRGDRGRIICAPQLKIGKGHVLTWEAGIDGRLQPTVRASVLCSDCGTHGFITCGRWANA